MHTYRILNESMAVVLIDVLICIATDELEDGAPKVISVDEAVEQLGCGFFQVFITFFSGFMWASIIMWMTHIDIHVTLWYRIKAFLYTFIEIMCYIKGNKSDTILDHSWHR